MAITANKTAAKTLAGVVGFFDDSQSLLAATEKVRDANYESFDTFTPFPVHGLEHAQGLRRSLIPWVTFVTGLAGGVLGFGFQYWTSAVDWAINVGGKPMNSWPAFVPVTFECTVLFAGLCTVGAMFLFNGFPNLHKRIFDTSVTRDRFAIVIDAPQPKKYDEDGEEIVNPLHAILAKFQPQNKNVKAFNEADVAAYLKSLGAHDVKSVYEEGWF